MNDKPQPFLGTIVAGLAAKVATNVAGKVIENVAERVMKRSDMPVANKDAGKVAEAVAREAAPAVVQETKAAVVEELKKDPKLKVAINGEPLWKSVNMWLGLGGVLSAVGTLLTLYFDGKPTDMETYVTAVAGLFTAIGIMARRASLQT